MTQSMCTYLEPMIQKHLNYEEQSSLIKYWGLGYDTIYEEEPIHILEREEKVHNRSAQVTAELSIQKKKKREEADSEYNIPFL